MLRLQLEVSQAKGDLERRVQEKEEEMEAARYLVSLCCKDETESAVPVFQTPLYCLCSVTATVRLRNASFCAFCLRKSHQRALESVQASLDVEVKGRAEALKLKKKLEADITELELQVDLLTKNNAELSKNSKKMQQQIKVWRSDELCFFFPPYGSCLQRIVFLL